MKRTLLSALGVFGYITGVATVFVLWCLILSSIGWLFGADWIPPRQWNESWLLLAPLVGLITAFTMAAIHGVYDSMN